MNIIGRLPLRIGDTFSYLAEFINEETTVAHDMTGWTVEASLRNGLCSAVGLTVTWIDQAIGQAKLNLSEEASAALDVGAYDLQIRTISPEGDSVSTVPAKVQTRE